MALYRCGGGGKNRLNGFYQVYLTTASEVAYRWRVWDHKGVVTASGSARTGCPYVEATTYTNSRRTYKANVPVWYEGNLIPASGTLMIATSNQGVGTVYFVVD